MNFKIGIFGFLAAVLLIVSCSKENIDINTEEEEETNAEVVNCDLSVSIEIDTIGFESAFTAIVDGGTEPYVYTWSTGDNTASITAPYTGTYEVSVIDSEGCVAMNTFATGVNSDCNNFTATATQVFNGNNVIANGMGGTEPYAYEWSNGATTQEIQVDTSGSYNVTIVDAIGCSATTTVSVNLDPCSTFQAYIVQDSMSTVLYVNVSGGTNPYAYLWSNGETDDSIVGDVGSTYEVTVVEGTGCAIVDSYQVQ